MTVRDLWRIDAPLDRGPYALVGLVAFTLKHNLDRLVASAYGMDWGILNYWIPLGLFAQLGSLLDRERAFLGALLLLSIPFALIGVVLTLRRLRSAGLSGGLVVLFFIPLLNLAFFLALCLLPPRLMPDGTLRSRPSRTAGLVGQFIPKSAWGSAALAVLITMTVGGVVTYLCVKTLGSYGWTLFLAIPFGMGMLSVLFYGYHEPRSLGACVLVAIGSCALLAVALLGLAFEGLICIVMASPITAALSIIGGIAGYFIQDNWTAGREGPALLAAVVLGLPSLGVLEGTARVAPTQFEVRTAIEVDAPPEVVWSRVVAFSSIPEPREWLFRAGIAYPKRAEIRGTGAGSVRHCVFSTGDFIEPIEVWDPPHLLRFSVSACPAPMEEWTPYGHIDTPHLRGFLVSRRGQFRLTLLPGGRTRLEGTTWYHHGLWPETYWRVWSDAIIHRIHRRVLEHIREESEASTAR